MIKRFEKLKKLKDTSLRVPWLSKLFDFSKTWGLIHVPRATPGFSAQRHGKSGILHRVPYTPDLLCILLALSIAFLSAGTPSMDLNVPPTARETPAVTLQAGSQEHGIVRKAEETKEIKVRNIFSATGAYTDTDAANRPLPEKPYTLIGVLYGKEMKAVFAEHTGSVVTMTVGKKMIDGFVITKIGNTSVKLIRGNEEKELKTFDVLNPEQAMTKKMANGSVIIINTGTSPSKVKGGAEEGKRERKAADISPRQRTADRETVDKSLKERVPAKFRRAEDRKE